MKSHKQLPKFIIKNFQNKSGKVYYYDIKNKLIGEAGPKVLGTEEGYFSNIIENLLNAKVESPFSAFLAKIKKNLF